MIKSSQVKKIPYLIYCLLHSIKINFFSFPFRTAIHFPIILGKNVRLINTHMGAIVINDEPHFNMIRIGVDNAMTPSAGTHGFINISDSGSIQFSGRANFNGATSIICNSGAIIKFGSNFSANTGCEFFADSLINFGDDVLIGWNCTFHDGDGHKVFINKEYSNHPKPIVLGSHIWITADCSFLKGSSISNGSIVAKGSLVTTQFKKENLLIGGRPARVIKEEITWEK